MHTSSYDDRPGAAIRGLASLLGLALLALAALVWSDSTGWWTVSALLVVPFIAALGTLAVLGSRRYQPSRPASHRLRFAAASGAVGAFVCVD